MVHFLLFTNTALLIALLVQRRRKEQPCNLQHAASLQRIEGALKTMATKQDVERLEAALGKAEEGINLVAEDTAALKRELTELNERANVDLGPAIARAESMEARLKGIAGAVAGSDPAAPPPAEGETGGDGETGGASTSDPIFGGGNE